MRFTPDKRGMTLPRTTVSCLVLMIIASCSRAADPELFLANPAQLDDFTSTLPKTGSSGGYNYAIIQGYAVLEGDILLGHVDAKGKIASKVQSRGLGRSDAFGRWPDGIVPYAAPIANSAVQRQNIALAIEHWTERTSITFVERTTENQDQYPSFIRFDPSNSCASFVGMQGDINGQSIMVSDACSMGSIVHEIGHALGLFHEHTRPDRDNFIQVDWNQIVAGKEINYNILNAGVENYGPYDYGSIMHYGEFFFSSTGERTIIAPDDIEIGQRDALSERDAASIDLMYATDLALSQPSISQSDDGLEVDITISNQGRLGAQLLHMQIELAEDSQWKGVSRDSGWQCLSHEAELRCTRPTLSEQSESRFTLLVDPATGDAEDISILLTSRTHDLDTGNNVINASYAPWEAADDNSNPDSDELESMIPTQEPEPPIQDIPVVAAAQGRGSSSADPASAGADNGSLIGLALLVWGWRRRRS